MNAMRLKGILLIAVVAMSFVVVSSALAFSSNPLFNPANKQTVTGEGGASTLKSKNLEISCTSNHIVSGTVSNSLLIGNIVIHYLGCVAVKGEEISGCPVNSTNTEGEGLILTNTLHAVLGLLLPSNETGILFLPMSGATFVTLAEAKKESKTCIPAGPVTGTVAALISPTGSKQTTGKVTVFPSGTLIDLTHGLGGVTSKVVKFGNTSQLEQSDNVTFGEPTEVT